MLLTNGSMVCFHARIATSRPTSLAYDCAFYQSVLIICNLEPGFMNAGRQTQRTRYDLLCVLALRHNVRADASSPSFMEL
jgi:hypothetical protein